MTKVLRNFLIAATVLFGGGAALAQPTYTITNVKDACAGNNNGSFDINILTANGPVTILIFGPPNFTRPTSAGLTESFTGLKPQDYIIIAQDLDGNKVAFQSIVNVTTQISLTGAPASANNSSCSAPNGSITISPTGGSGPYIFSWTGPGAFSASTQNLSGLAGGVYTVTITNATNNCQFVSAPVTITDPSPTDQPFSTTSPENICAGNPASVTLASTQVLTLPLSYYELLKNGLSTGVKASGTGGPLTLTLAAGFVNGDVLTVRAVDDLCAAVTLSGSVTLAVHTPATSATLSGTASICQGTSTNLSVAFVGGTGPYSITINNGVGTINNYASGSAIPVSPGATTTYSLTAATDANGCPAQSLAGSAVVTVKPAPTSAVLSGTTSLCAGTGPVNISVAITGGTSPYSFTINNGVGLITNYTSGSPIPVNPGVNTTYAIVGNVSDAGGCSVAGTGSAVISVNTPPTSATLSLSAGATNPICVGSSSKIKVVIVGGAGPYNFTITGLGAQVGYVSGTDIIVNPVVTTTYSIAGNLITDSKGCTVTGAGSTTITVNPLPSGVISASPATICSGSGTSTLTFTFTGTGPFNVTYTDGVTPTTLSGIATGFTVAVSPAITTSYTISAISDANCVGAPGSSTTVNVNPRATSATLSGTTSICPGDPVSIKVDIIGGAGPFTIDITGVGIINNYATGAAIPVTPVATTTYTLNSVTDVNGCTPVSLLGNAVVTVNPAPTSAVLGGGVALCGGTGPVNISVAITGGVSPYSFTIDNGVGGIINYVSGTAIPVNPAVTTTYSIVGNVVDANGCKVAGTGGATITVNTPPSSATLSGATTICPGSTTNLSVAIVGGAGPYAVTIDNGVGTIPNYVSGSPIPVTPGAATTYNLISVVDFLGCNAQALNGSAAIALFAPPTSAVLGGSVALCGGTGPVNISVTITGGTGPYSFTIDNGVGLQTLYASGSPISVNPAVTTTYSIVGNVTDANGCSVAGSGSAVISINTPPSTAVLSGAASICPGSSTNLVVAITGGVAPYSVTIDNGVGTILNYTSGSAIPVTPAAAITYNLVSVTDANGCVAQALSGSAPITLFTPPSNAAISVSGPASVCAGTGGNVAVTITGGVSPYTVTIDNGVPVVSNYVSGTPIPVSPAATTTYSITSVKDANGCNAQALSGSALITVIPLSTATMSGDNSICEGGSSTISVALTGSQPWTIVYTDGSSNFSVPGISASPYTFPVTPAFSTTYSMVSVIDATCPAGTVSGSADITVTAIGGNPATPGIDTWLGYVYDDAGDPTPLPGRINFSNAKYRGVIDETDIAGMSPFSTYTSATDEFDLNISNNASGFNIHSPNVCGTYKDHFSIRYRMTKTFTKGVYTFTLGSDDGVRMFLDGVNILPGAFTNHLYTTYTTAAQCISAGAHDLVIEYYENTAFSRLTFNYQAAAAPTVTSPVSICIGSSAPTLTASSVDPAVIGFNWYKDAGLVTLLSSGANFVPAAADLNTGTLGTTSFFVTALYACGETVAAQQDVNVINSATITPPASPFQVCQTSGTLDLTTVVSAVPAGGTFVFSGTGITTSPTFDPTLVAGSSTITVSYTSGTCSTSTTFTIGVVTTASITVPASPVVACQSSAPIDMTTLVTATPTGGAFTFTGPGVAGNLFDPSAQSGAVAITVDYNAGGCTDSKTLNFNVVPTATVTTTNPPATCPTAGLIDLTTLVSAVPSGGAFTFSGPGVVGTNFDPSGQAGTTATISVGYNIGGCTAVGTISITVNASCGSNCGAFNVVITDSRPTCQSQIDGSININVTGGTPNYVVTLFDGGSFNQALPGPGPLFAFSNLSPANYFYTIADNAGNKCTLPHSLPVQTSVQAVGSNFADANCFNQPVGSATITVTSGGTAPYEYSIDGGTTWIGFTSPVVVNNLMPLGAYSILVRDDAADPCPAQVPVTINNAVADIANTNTITNATCANNDGAIQILTVTGGTSPYTYQLDGVAFATLPPSNTFTGLTGGSHIFSVIDANSCRKDFPFVVIFPGLVNFTTSSVAPDCSGNGSNGSLVVTVSSIGSFTVGISADPVVPPTTFQNVVSAGAGVVIFNNLAKGTYYVTAQAIGAQCPTVSAASISAGPSAVSFAAASANMICFTDPGGVVVSSIIGAAATDYQYQIVQTGSVVQSGTITSLQAVGSVTLTGLGKGTFQIQLSQDQSASSGCPSPILSPFVSFTVTGPTAELDTLSVAKTVSFPDLPSGSMLVTVAESGAEPYELRLELTQPLIPTQGPFVLDWTAMSRNPQDLKIEYKAKNLYAGEYQLSLRDSLGCVKTYAVDLGVNMDISIPNIFTPNDDGVNDVFYIRNLPAATFVVVTNRWGKEVYRTSNYQNDWNGGNIDDGVYYYKVNAGGQTFNGWVEIQRALGH